MANRIKGLTIEIGGDTVKLENSLRQVNGTISKTQSALRDVDKLLKLDPKNTDLVKQKQQMLGKEIDATKSKLEQLRQAQAQMDANGVDKNSEQYQGLQREIIATEQELKRFEQQQMQLKFDGIERMGHKLQDVGGKMQSVGKTMSTYVTGPIAAGGAVAVKKFAEVDKTMQLTNKTMGNTKQQADMLNKAMKDAASNSTYGMEDAAGATLNFARAGLSAEESAAALAPAMNLAAGEGGNLDTVSGGLVATINGFGGSFDEAEHYADVFANACNNSALEIDTLSESMSVAAPVFAAAGYSVKDAALYMGVMGNAGIDANVAANSLKTGMARLVEPSKQGAEWMKKLGISMTNADGTMKDSVTVQKELHDAFGGLSESQQIAAASAIFGKNQMSNWLALINTAPEDVDSLSKSLENEGTTSEMANAMMNGFGGSLEKLKSSVDVLVESFGEALAPTIQKVTNKVQGVVDWFNSLSDEQKQLVAKIALVVAAIGPALLIAGKIVSTVGMVMGSITKIIGTITKLGGAIGKVFSLVAANPWILAIMAIIAAIVLIVTHWEQIKEKLGKIWDAIKQKVETVWTAIKNFFTTIWEAIKSVFSTVLKIIKTVIFTYINIYKTIITTVFNAIKTVITTIWNGIKAFFTKIFSAIKTAVVTYFNAYKFVIVTVFNAIKTAITTIVNGIKTVITTVFNAIKNFLTTVWTAIKNKASSIWTGIKNVIVSPIKNAIQTVKDVFNAVRTWLSNKFTSIRDLAKSKFNAVKDAILSPIRTARDTIKSIIHKIKGWFDNFHISIPDIPLPHFKIYPEGWRFRDLLKGIKPDLDIEWYAKAMKNGIIMNEPTVFGAMNGKLMAGGEAGSETVVGTSSLMQMIQSAVNAAIDTDQLAAAVQQGAYEGTSNITLTVDGRLLGRELGKMGVVFK